LGEDGAGEEEKESETGGTKELHRRLVGGTGWNVERARFFALAATCGMKGGRGTAMRTSVLILAVLAGMATAGPARAEYPWWVIGQRDINSASGDRLVIPVQSGRRFLSMRLCVQRQGVNFRAVEVRYREGGSQSFLIRGVVPNQRCSGDIALPGGDRALAEVAIVYDSAGLNSRGARMQLHGR
jgi:hypothetical protein